MSIEDVTIEGSTVAVQVMVQDSPVVGVEVFGQETPFGGVQILGANDDVVQVTFGGTSITGGGGTGGGSGPVLPPSTNLVTSVFTRIGDVVAMPGDYAEFFAPLGTELPPGGLTGQALVKLSDAGWDTGWVDVAAGGGAVDSVFGRTGVVTALSTDYASFYQPLDSDLTSIAALATTSFGRGSLIQADAAAFRAYIGAGTGGGGTPGGSNTYVQFNDAGAFGGDLGLTYNKTTGVLQVFDYVRAGIGSQTSPSLSFAAGTDSGLFFNAFMPMMAHQGRHTMAWSNGTFAKYVKIPSNVFFGFDNTVDLTGASDIGISRNAPSVMEVNDGLTLGNYRDLKLRSLISTGGTITGAGAVPTGGATGQVLAKVTATNYDVAWAAPATGGGGGDLSFVFTQVAPATSWPVPHNLGKFPSVSVVDSGGSWILPSILYVDSNNVTINFGAATSGKAYCN
jgi:hypothetical protein